MPRDHPLTRFAEECDRLRAAPLAAKAAAGERALCALLTALTAAEVRLQQLETRVAELQAAGPGKGRAP